MGKADPITATTTPDAGHPYKSEQKVPRAPQRHVERARVALPASTPPSNPAEMPQDDDMGVGTARAAAAPGGDASGGQFVDTPPAGPPGPDATGPAPGGGWEEEKQRRLAAAAALSRVAALGDEERRRLQQTIIDEEIAHQRAQGAMLESQAKERQQLLADGEQRRLRLQAELQSKVVQGPQPLCNTKGTLLGDYLPQHSAAQNSQDSGTQHTSAFEGKGSENLSQVRLIREGRI